MTFIGVDIGGTTTKASLVDEAGTILDSLRVETVTDDLERLLNELVSTIRVLASQRSVRAIGIGIPGLRRKSDGVIEVAPNIPCLHEVSLEARLADVLKLPVYSENDANAAAIGEWHCGAARGLSDFVYLTIGTGLGCGLFMNGSLYTGSSGYAGEFGHTIADPDGYPCECGNVGCFETVVSAKAIVRRARDRASSTPQSWMLAPDLTSEDVHGRAAAGDPEACRIFEESGRCLGRGLSNLVNLFNPEAIVLAGGVMAAGDLLLRPAIEEAGRRAFVYPWKRCRVLRSELGTSAGEIGAAMLAREMVGRPSPR